MMISTLWNRWYLAGGINFGKSAPLGEKLKLKKCICYKNFIFLIYKSPFGKD